MKRIQLFTKNILSINVIVLLVMGILLLATSACTPRQDPQAAIDAAVAATGNAQLANQATIDAAVQATTAAQMVSQATLEAAVQATQTAQPAVQPTPDAADVATPVPASSAEYVTMTEEELAALIDQAVTEAVAATEQYSTAATEATADGTMTTAEVQTVEVYVSAADEAIALAEEMLNVYYDLYSDVAGEAVTAIEEMNETLAYVAETTDEMTAALNEINSTLEQGLALAEETITELESAAQAASEQAASVKQEMQTWATTRQSQIEAMQSAVSSIQPNQIAGDPAGAIQSAFDFIGVGQEAVADGNVSPEELATLAQLGANASASLNGQGAPQFQQLAGSINTITGQLGQGDLAQAQAGLTQLGVDTALAVQPNQVAGDLTGAVQIALNFANSGQQALADGAISVPELANLAQLGANARASLDTHGGPQFQQFTGSINDITGQLARGEVPQAQEALTRFGGNLGAVPDLSKPTLPEKPTLPDNPSRPARP
ncbi:MAG: hypothetical protein AB1801_26800 [Chloroflexota bacterium]